MDNLRDIVNGGQLVAFINKPVSITGKVKRVSPDGMNVDLQAVDDKIIKVNLKLPIKEDIVDHWVEVRGISTGKEVDTEDYTVFSNHDFDAKAHNTLCQLLYSIPNLWQTSYSDEEDYGTGVM